MKVCLGDSHFLKRISEYLKMLVVPILKYKQCPNGVGRITRKVRFGLGFKPFYRFEIKQVLFFNKFCT